MELTHRFTVPAGLHETWSHFNDIASVAGCFPGAVVTEVEGDAFKGSCKVKLGPIALVYNGAGSFLEKDESAHRFVIEAKGKDKRGNGTAGATVTATFAEAGSATDVEVLTHLSITGKPAQFGRGVMQDVSDKLLQQFVTCLAQRFEAPAPAPEAPSPAATGAAEAAREGAGGGVEAAPATGAADVGQPAAAAPPPPAAASAEALAAGGDEAGAEPTGRAGPAAPQPQPQEALDLGATVLPVLARTYWKQALGLLVVVLVLRRLLRRRR